MDRRGLKEGIALLLGGMSLLAAASVATYAWAPSVRPSLSPREVHYDPSASRVLTQRDWYLELHPDGSASWYRTPCQYELGHGRWNTSKDGVTLVPDAGPIDQASWKKLVPARIDLVLKPDGAGFFSDSAGVGQEWNPRSGPPLPCVPSPPPPAARPHDPRFDGRWCGVPDGR